MKLGIKLKGRFEVKLHKVLREKKKKKRDKKEHNQKNPQQKEFKIHVKEENNFTWEPGMTCKIH